jgi:hypothetical protein
MKAISWSVIYPDDLFHAAALDLQLPTVEVNGFGSLPEHAGTTFLFMLLGSVYPSFQVGRTPVSDPNEFWFLSTLLVGPDDPPSPNGTRSLFVRRIAQVSEPASLVLLAVGVLALLMRTRARIV